MITKKTVHFAKTNPFALRVISLFIIIVTSSTLHASQHSEPGRQKSKFSSASVALATLHAGAHKQSSNSHQQEIVFKSHKQQSVSQPVITSSAQKSPAQSPTQLLAPFDPTADPKTWEFPLSAGKKVTFIIGSPGSTQSTPQATPTNTTHSPTFSFSTETRHKKS